jgi:Fe-S-cluster containining protein
MQVYKNIVRWFEKKLGTRCTGDCCKRFFLPCSPDELKASYDNALKETRVDGVPWYRDIETIYPMVELVAIENRNDSAGIKHFYRCKNLTKNGDCGIYDKRPWMCSEYPYGGGCAFEGCTWGKVSGKGLLFKIGRSCKKVKNNKDLVKQLESKTSQNNL